MINEVKLTQFLLKHDNYTLFLLSNYAKHGPYLTDALNSGNFKVIEQAGEIIAAYCLCRRGTLLVQSEQSCYDAIIESCLKEEVPLKGMIGEWSFCHPFWEYLKKKGIIHKEGRTSKEVLYSVEVNKYDFPTDPQVRVLNPNNFHQWLSLRKEYTKEIGFPVPESEEQMRQLLLEKIDQKISWGLFQENQLVAIADLNARVLDLGQVGGVFTKPSQRGKGFAKRLMKQIIHDAKDLGIRKLIIFTGEDNTSARKVYESLDIKHVGYYALLFSQS